ncbi:MAG: ferrochelatase [Candidatus Omnitrophota bacterium]
MDHFLLIGYGGPRHAGEVDPYLERITAGKNLPASRLREVREHYLDVGGVSPYNAHVLAFADSLERSLRDRGNPLPVFVGMRNWHPFLSDTLASVAEQGLKKGFAFILAPHRSEASCLRYKRSLDEAVEFSGVDIDYHFPGRWHTHPLFIRALAANLRAALEKAGPAAGPVAVIFSAHSIPRKMLGACPHCDYEKEYRATCEAVAREAGLLRWSLAYQSASGGKTGDWLGPDILEALRAAAQEGARSAVVMPAGFLCDHVEILYDLDREAKAECEKLGLGFFRAATVMERPEFLEMTAGMARPAEVCR